MSHLAKVAAAVLIALLHGASAAQQVEPAEPTVDIRTWETTDHGVTFSLTQILPDQARAFYVNRGFPLEATEAYANSCVFMTVLRNDSAPGTVHFKLVNWSVVTIDKAHPPVSVDEWLKRLKIYNLDQPALLAFRWAQFPPEQEYQPGGDWNQGMLTTGLPAGARFDLVARWDVSGKSYEGVLKNVVCAN